MTITIAVYNSTYSQLAERVGAFDTAEEAAHFRDHCSLGNENTKLEILGRHDSYIPVELYELYGVNDGVNVSYPEPVDYSHAEENGWAQTDEGWLCND